MRILGLDYGDKTVGVAVSDPFGWSAQGLEIIRRNSPEEYKQSLGRIEEIIKQYGVEKIVLGFPKHLNGSEGARCEKTLAYKSRLEKRFNMEIVLWDERLSTVAADRYMLMADIGHDKRKENIDKMAAVFILQGYLDSLKNNENTKNNDYDTIWLEDDDGEEKEFDITDEKEIDGSVYIFVCESKNNTYGEKAILKEIIDEDGEESYEVVEDESELRKVENIFNKRITNL